MENKKYGVVYTPDRLASFAAELLLKETQADNFKIQKILDPACGECILLSHAVKESGYSFQCIGIDVEKGIIDRSSKNYIVVHDDAIMPKNTKKKSADYWRKRLGAISAIIANPPWSSEKIYNRTDLQNAGFTLVEGQYDSYVLFLELAYQILVDGGYLSFIIPDSLFDAQNEKLRLFLLKKMQIRVIARLGEKVFDGINRATIVIVCRKMKPDKNSKTKCFRLTTKERKEFLSTKKALMDFYRESVHEVEQARFTKNESYNFDIDTRKNEENLIQKIKAKSIKLEDRFTFGRGVEISKTGKIVTCPHCNYAQGYKKAQMEVRAKICTNCGCEFPINNDVACALIKTFPFEGASEIYVGKNIQRYVITGQLYIQPDVCGINYKVPTLYDSPKILIRKTGLGIYAVLDSKGRLTSQTVYILKRKNIEDQAPLEYYLAMLNSRVVYYYYLKVYGENEWKSHPYLTKKIILSLPMPKYVGNDLDFSIVELAQRLVHEYSYETDIELEYFIMRKFGLSRLDISSITTELNSLPDLSSINGMKMVVSLNV